MCSAILQIIAIVYFIVGTIEKKIKCHMFIGCSFVLMGGINIYNNLWILGMFFIILALIELSEAFSDRRNNNNGVGDSER